MVHAHATALADCVGTGRGHFDRRRRCSRSPSLRSPSPTSTLKNKLTLAAQCSAFRCSRLWRRQPGYPFDLTFRAGTILQSPRLWRPLFRRCKGICRRLSSLSASSIRRDKGELENTCSSCEKRVMTVDLAGTSPWRISRPAFVR